MNIKAIGTGLALAAAAASYASNAQAWEPGDLMVTALLEGFYTDASGSVGEGLPLNYTGGDVTANPALNLTYFFTKNISAHTVLAVPLAKVDLSNSGHDDWASSQRVLPLSIIAQYHFFGDELISPYFGVGGTRAFFWEDSTSNKFGGDKIKVDDAWGGLINFGVDYKVKYTNWVITLDAKKWWLADTGVKLGSTHLDDASINPWLFGIGLGYKFSTPAVF